MKLQSCTHHTWTTPLLCSVIRCYFKYLKNPKIVVCHAVAMLHTSHLNNLIQYLPKEPKKSYLHWSCTHYTWITELLCSVLRCFLRPQNKQKNVICYEVVKLHTPHLNALLLCPVIRCFLESQNNQKIVICHEVMKLHMSHLNNSIAMLSNKVL